MTPAQDASDAQLIDFWLRACNKLLGGDPGLFNAAGSAGLSLICNRRGPKRGG
jgi:hypothetical protein